MLLQILGTLEGFAAELALVGLKGHMDANMRRDVVALDGGGAARVPTAGEVQVVCALATDMALADVLVESLRGGELLEAALAACVPAAGQIVAIRRRGRVAGGCGAGDAGGGRRGGL